MHYLRCPFQRERDFGVTSVNYDLAELIERAEGHSRPMPFPRIVRPKLEQVLPALPRGQIKRLLDELRREGRVRLLGERRGARWVATGAP